VTKQPCSAWVVQQVARGVSLRLRARLSDL
jgi:hypothetical protein